MENILFCSSGGCTAKLGPKALSKVLSKLTPSTDPMLLVGTESSDDGAVYQLTDEIAMVQTLDFFPPMVEDPYLFGQIAAANALSDIYAMGGEVKTALNIVCFPEDMELDILGKILQGGSEKVREAGGSLVGGHSIHDTSVKYGLSVTGIVHPNKIMKNIGAKIGDILILTKPLGVGIVSAARTLGAASEKALALTYESMATLNKYSSEISKKYEVHGCTDITGFGFLGHLQEMMTENMSVRVKVKGIPVIPEALEYSEAFYITGAAQRNRNFVGESVRFKNVTFGMEEILFDPQTSGGLLIAVAPEDAQELLKELQGLGLPVGIVGEMIPRMDVSILVEG